MEELKSLFRRGVVEILMTVATGVYTASDIHRKTVEYITWKHLLARLRALERCGLIRKIDGRRYVITRRGLLLLEALGLRDKVKVPKGVLELSERSS